MNTDMLSTTVVDGIAVVTLGSPQKMYFDMAWETASRQATGFCRRSRCSCRYHNWNSGIL